MSKTKEELLLTYKKSNRIKRLAIVLKAGFQTEAEYLAFLMEDKAEDRPIIHSVYIIDVSWSMVGPKLESAIAGVNAEIAELQKDDTAEYLQTIVNFSSPSEITTVVDKLPIAKVGKYHAKALNSTALNQTIGETLTKVRKEKWKNEKVLVKIFTDGQENTSTGEFDNSPAGYKAVSDLIKACEADGFTVTFVGTDRDVRTVVDNMHIDLSNTLVHDNTTRGVMMAFCASTDATLSYAKNVKARKSVEKGFYKTIK